VSWEHIFRLPRQICEKYLRNITLLECSIFSASTLSSTDVTRQPAKSLLKPDTGTLTALLPLSLLFSAEGTQATAARARAHKDQKRFRHDPHPALFSAVFAVLLARDLQRMCRLFRSQRSC
jgi:hypothetical protein